MPTRTPTIDAVRAVTRVATKTQGKVKLSDWPSNAEHLYAEKDVARASLDEDAAAINTLQDALFAERRRAVLVVLQGIDTSGKDGTAKSVFKFSSPLGVRVHPFGAPTAGELAHDYLWRVHRLTPGRGQIAVFNRSHYEDVLVARVRKLAPAHEIEQRYDQINAFEKHLHENGTCIIKLMLHISKDEQGKRLRERLEIPEKRWKFDPGDIDDRKLWDEYQTAYSLMIERCSTELAPWHVIPSDGRTKRDAIAARLVRGLLEDMKPSYPDPGYRLSQFKID